MFPPAEQSRDSGLSLVEVLVALAIASIIGFGLWKTAQATFAAARQNEAKLDASEQVATLFRRVADAAAAMARGSRIEVTQNGVSFVSTVLSKGASRRVASSLRNQCVKAQYTGFDASAVAASSAWKGCTGAPRCESGAVPTIVLAGPFSRPQRVPASSQTTVANQRLIGAYFCATAASPDQVILTVVGVRSAESGSQSLVTDRRTVVLGYNSRLSDRVQLFLPAGGKK